MKAATRRTPSTTDGQGTSHGPPRAPLAGFCRPDKSRGLDAGADHILPGAGQPDPGDKPVAGTEGLLDEAGIDVDEPRPPAPLPIYRAALFQPQWRVTDHERCRAAAYESGVGMISEGEGSIGAHEDGDTAADDAVGLGVGELDGAHHGFAVDLAERQSGQVLGGLGGIVGVEQAGRG